MADMTRAHVFIEGRVQGVGFRHFTKKTAVRHGINGWVRNLSDGRVEAVFEGAEEKVEKVIDACRQGPPISKVENLNVDWEEYEDEFDQFEVAF